MIAKEKARGVAKQSRAHVKQDKPQYITTKSMVIDFVKSCAALFVLWLMMWLCYFAFAQVAM